MGEDADNAGAAAVVLGRAVSHVARLPGGQHAVTTVVSDGHADHVVRRFPAGDPAVSREVAVLPRLAALGTLVPRLIAFDDAAPRPVIVTDRVRGSAPGPALAPERLAVGMGRALARIHALDGTGLPPAPAGPPAGTSPAARRAQRDWPRLVRADRVLTHGDFWCGNALWVGDELTGVVDWGGGRHAPRGLDVAWGRLDLVLLGSSEAADLLVREYELTAGLTLPDVTDWDVFAVAHADPQVETWAVNYAGTGRPQLTGTVLRRRFDDWTRRLLGPGP